MVGRARLPTTERRRAARPSAELSVWDTFVIAPRPGHSAQQLSFSTSLKNESAAILSASAMVG